MPQKFEFEIWNSKIKRGKHKSEKKKKEKNSNATWAGLPHFGPYALTLPRGPLPFSPRRTPSPPFSHCRVGPLRQAPSRTARTLVHFLAHALFHCGVGPACRRSPPNRIAAHGGDAPRAWKSVALFPDRATPISRAGVQGSHVLHLRDPKQPRRN